MRHYMYDIIGMAPHKPSEKDYYLPILDTLRSFGGSANLDEIRLTVRPFYAQTITTWKNSQALRQKRHDLTKTLIGLANDLETPA